MSHTRKFAEDGTLSISTQHHFTTGDLSDRDLRARERVLNSAIIAADISRGWEEYLELIDAFYADDVEVSGETGKELVRGKARVRALLFTFLFPLHVMAEIGGLSIQIRESPIHGDVAEETHSAWSVDLIGVSTVGLPLVVGMALEVWIVEVNSPGRIARVNQTGAPFA